MTLVDPEGETHAMSESRPSESESSEDVDRREGLRRGALAALALSLGIPARLLADTGEGAGRFEIKFYAGDRFLESLTPDGTTTRYLEGRPTAIQVKWYDLERSPREPLTVLGLTESLQLKIEWSADDGARKG